MQCEQRKFTNKNLTIHIIHLVYLMIALLFLLRIVFNTLWFRSETKEKETFFARLSIQVKKK